MSSLQYALLFLEIVAVIPSLGMTIFIDTYVPHVPILNISSENYANRSCKFYVFQGST